MFPYEKKFYQDRKSSLLAAREIMPLVLEIIQPRHVVDIGCGMGNWLSVCRDYGVEDILGVDGPWVDKRLLLIPEATFSEADISKPIELGRVFDLAICVEVAEHVSGEYEKVFMDSLTKAAPVILFSADIPHGGGVGHLNEQWQNYWANLFQERHFMVIDSIRPAIWNNEKVQWWYRQNIFLFVKKDYLDAHPRLKEMFERWKGFPLNIVHPALFEETANPRTMSLKKAITAIPYGVFRVVKRAIRGILK